MKRHILLLVLLSLTAIYASEAQSIEWVLGQVEQNNASLAARRKLTDAQIIEARMGNTLEDPQVEYSHVWGNRSELGHNGELTLVQQFDFPTLYSQRGKVSDIRKRQYGHQYDAFRQQILLDAQTAYIDIVSFRQQGRLLLEALTDAERVAAIFSRRVEAGAANVLEENKAKFELATARNAYGRNRIDLAAAENRLANLNGGIAIPITNDIQYVPDETLPAIDEMYAIYEGASAELLDVLCESEAAEREVKVSKGQSLPKITLGYKFEHAGGERFNGVIAGLSIPIFANRHNVSRAKAQSLYAEAETLRVRTDLRSSLEQWYAQAELLKATLAEYSSITVYSDAAALLSKALDAGHISVTDYYTELRPIVDNRLAVAELRRELLTTLARIRMVEL